MMPILAEQLELWSSRGSIQQSSETYETLKKVLTNSDAPYKSQDFEIFLQGSFRNGTNISSDSDIDIVIELTSISYSDAQVVNIGDFARNRNHIGVSDYTLERFRSEVASWLRENLGYGVRSGRKAIFVPETDKRRSADVLPCVEHRSYVGIPGVNHQDYHSGIIFQGMDGKRTINYPKQHSNNCEIKDKSTNGLYVPSVRIFKNMRNEMIKSGILKVIAPSYFIECLLSNIPDDVFSGDYMNIVGGIVNYLNSSDEEDFSCGNKINRLVRDGGEIWWPKKEYRQYLEAVNKFWNKV